MAYLFYIWKFVPLDSLHTFHLSNPSEKHLVFLHYFDFLLANLVFFGKKKCRSVFYSQQSIFMSEEWKE